MCQNHVPTYGKKAVIALIEAEFNPKGACDARIRYLNQQVEKFRTWLQGNGCADVDAVITNLEESTRKLLRNPVDNEFIWSREHDLCDNKDGKDILDESLTDINAGKEEISFRLEEEEVLHTYYWMNLEDNASKAVAKTYKETPYVVEKWVEFLCKVQDVFYINSNYLPKQTWSACNKARSRIFVQRKTKLMSYEDWALLTNWVNRMMGSPKRYEIPDTEEEVSVDPEDVAICFYETDATQDIQSTETYVTME